MTTYASAKIGIRKTKTPEGFVRLHDVRISRVGEMRYAAGQTPVPVGADGVAYVTRDEAVVFEPESLASWVGKPVTIRHPTTAVTTDNWSELAAGHIENARRGADPFADFMVGDVLVTRPDAIQLAMDGCEISGGYDAAYETLSPGRGRQTKIVGNHLAFLPDGIKGRCGPMCYVGDQSMDIEEPIMTDKTKLFGSASMLRKLFGAKDDAEVMAVLDQAAADEAAAATTALQATIDQQAVTIAQLTKDKEDAEKKAKEKDDDEDEDKKTPTADALTALRPRIAAAAEILSPGLTIPTVDATGDLKATFDALCGCQRTALENAMKTDGGKVIVGALLGEGGDVSKLTSDQLGANFFAAANMLGATNNAVFAAMAARAVVGNEIETNISRSAAAQKASDERWGERRKAQANLH